MSIVTVDSQRRIYLPKELDFNAKKAIIIHRGDTYLLIPVPDRITEIDAKLTIKELKDKAEEKAKGESRDAHRI